MVPKSKISVVVLTKNEENKLEECLKSLVTFAEIIVIDDCSNDKTVEIAKKYTSKVYSKDLTDFSEKRNFGAAIATYDIIFQVDADERVPEVLAEEISRLDFDKSAAFFIPRKNFIAGRWLKGGGFGIHQDYQPRLYNRQLCQWRGTVHEQLVAPSYFKLNNYLIHEASSSFFEAFENFDDWTTLTARWRRAQGNSFNYRRLYIFPVLEFIRRYVVLGGFLDGLIGWRLAWRHAFGKYVIESKLKHI